MGTHGVKWLFGKLWENMFMPQIRAAPLAALLLQNKQWMF